MNVRFLLASLVFILLGGNSHSFAGVDASGMFPSYTAQKSIRLAANLEQPGVENITPVNTGFPKEIKILVCEDAVEEDENDSSERKERLEIGFHVATSYHSFFHFLPNTDCALPQIWQPVSYRYILQRNLRI